MSHTDMYCAPAAATTSTLTVTRAFFFQAEDGIRDWSVTGVPDVCSSDLEEHTSELQPLTNLVCRLLLEDKTCALPNRKMTRLDIQSITTIPHRLLLSKLDLHRHRTPTV